jgi:CPA1 family monovalent cation:H+ antiporter
VVGYLAARLYLLGTERVRDPASYTVLTFVGVFGVWLGAERLGLSAIVTMVVYAITLAHSGAMRQSPRNRVSSYATWETVIFTVNVLAFVLMGLQARSILERLAGDGIVPALAFSLAVLAIVILVRLIYVLTYNEAVRLKNRVMGVRLPPGMHPPTGKSGIVISWAGMRGLVTLATAFALPQAFPNRDLLVLAAFVVVLGTLVIQGLTLKPLVSALKLDPDPGIEHEVARARRAVVNAAFRGLDGDASPEADQLRLHLKAQLDAAQNLEAPQAPTRLDELRLKLVPLQREALSRLRIDGEISDEAYHRIEEDLDWAELDATPHGGFAPLTSTGT